MPTHSFHLSDYSVQRWSIALLGSMLLLVGHDATASTDAPGAHRSDKTTSRAVHTTSSPHTDSEIPERRPYLTGTIDGTDALRTMSLTLATPGQHEAGGRTISETTPRTDPHRDLSMSPDTQRTIQFSGFRWDVRDRYGPPGPNEWSDSEQSVWVDDEGRLHLKIRKIDSNWHSAELSTVASLGYGTYTFTIASDVEAYDENVVAGLFTYRNGPEEIDIEFSKWGGAFPDRNGTYTVWSNEDIDGVGVPEATERFDLNLSGRPSTHQFTWTNHRVAFRSWQGREEAPSQSTLIHEWSHVGPEVPDADNEKLYLNFWLFQGNPPAGQIEPELVIESVDYRSQHVRAEQVEVSVYPSPIRTQGTIRYTLPEQTSVTLEIYDLLGRHLQTLVDEEQRSGIHRVRWPRERSSSLSTGTYFYRLQVGGHSTFRKVTLIR